MSDHFPDDPKMERLREERNHELDKLGEISRKDQESKESWLQKKVSDFVKNQDGKIDDDMNNVLRGIIR